MKKEKVWIVVDEKGKPYVDFRYTKKAMIEHHLSSVGWTNWKQAYNSGDRVIKATLTFNPTTKQ